MRYGAGLIGLLVVVLVSIATPSVAQAQELATTEPESRCYYRFRSSQRVGLDFEGIADANRIIVFQKNTPVANLKSSRTRWNASDELSTLDGPLSVKLKPSGETFDCRYGTSSIYAVEQTGPDLMSCNFAISDNTDRLVYLLGDIGSKNVQLRNDYGWIANVTGYDVYSHWRIKWQTGLFMRVRTPVSVVDVPCEVGGFSRFQERDEIREIPDVPSRENANFRAYIPHDGTLFVENKMTGEIRTFAINTSDVSFHSVSEDGNTVWWLHEASEPRWADLSALTFGYDLR